MDKNDWDGKTASLGIRDRGLYMRPLGIGLS